MLNGKTHVEVDDAMHKIARVEQHADGPGHTHRVHLGCGTTIDLDLGGLKAQAREFERAGHVLSEKNHAAHAMHMQAAADAVAKAESIDGGRWHANVKAKGCKGCVAHEKGDEAVVAPLGHTPPTTVEADIETSIACPLCGSRIYKRRKTGQFACTGQGHEFEAAELMSHVKSSFEQLTKLGAK